MRWLVAVTATVAVFGVCLWLFRFASWSWMPHATSDRWAVAAAFATVTAGAVGAAGTWWASRETPVTADAGGTAAGPSVPAAGKRAVAAGGDISGIASTGDYAINVQYRAERMTVLPAEAFRPWAELAVPPGLANLPTPPGLFVGRAGELARLDAALAGPGGVVVQAVHGLGGIGKSTLAVYWAAARAGEYTLTWWITAATPVGIDAALAVALQSALSGVLPIEALREGAVQWLAAHQGWLLVLDNVTDPADVAPLLARAPAGRYLITSRRATGWHATAVPVRLDVLDPAEAQALLSAILTQDRPREVDGGAELGFLPLAVEQAGAYLAQAGATPREYLGLLARYPAAMYQAAADAARTIARIWHVTLDRLADDPLAGQVLRILAWYAPEAIPRALLDGLADPPALLRAVGRLAAYSMLTAEADVLAVHRLVQAVTRTPDPGDPYRSPQAIDEARDQARLACGNTPTSTDLTYVRVTPTGTSFSLFAGRGARMAADAPRLVEQLYPARRGQIGNGHKPTVRRPARTRLAGALSYRHRQPHEPGFPESGVRFGNLQADKGSQCLDQKFRLIRCRR